MIKNKCGSRILKFGSLIFLQIKTMIGFAEAECNNEETASADGCKQLLAEEVFATERKNN